MTEEEFGDSYYKLAWRVGLSIAFRLGRPREDGEEAASDALYTLWTTSRVEVVQCPRAYLARMIRWRLLPHGGAVRPRFVSLTASNVVLAPDPSMRPDEVLEAQERLQTLRKAVDSTGPSESTVLSLEYFDELDLREVAGALGIGYVAARQRHRRGLGKLRKLLGPLYTSRRRDS